MCKFTASIAFWDALMPRLIYKWASIQHSRSHHDVQKRVSLLPALLICIQVHAAPGFRQLALTDPQGKSLDVAVWYPTSAAGKTENVGANPAFEGVAVIRNAPARPGAHPLLVISHGYNGNWRNLSWIAAAMAVQGYIVAAPDHPGTTTFNQDPRDAKRLWRRPQDLSQVIDFTLRSSALVGR
ncbi:Predicted dienelactone hydrolase [Raoultella terrigena]|uniref:Predicted dienelactone hydrolase n=1 Tax=Raoultella terrigena TaxID=577 RepID=A0A4U9CTC4_RAOTE|nr:Predicted dienelactone hydrolase [Raoultella terrigena]